MRVHSCLEACGKGTQRTGKLAGRFEKTDETAHPFSGVIL
jgi:hypothetical protein